MKVMLPGYKTLCLLIIGLLISVQNLSAQTPPGNPRPDANMPVLMQPAPGKNYRVDLLSMETGAAIYSTWGHTALRIYDRETGRDAVFDFGLFDFSDTFVVRFLQGQPAFILGVSSLPRTLYRYALENRPIYAQQIHMNDDDARLLYTALLQESRPENRSFLYHHFLNNCTIRVRDIIDREMGGRLKSYFKNRPADGITFRSSSMDLMFSNPILWYGTNLIMGPAVDRPVSEWELMYLPLEFMRLMDEYRLAHPTDASTQQSSYVYVGPIETYLEYQHPPEEDGTVFNWVGMFLFEAIVIGLLFIWPALAPTSPSARTAFRIGWLSWNLGAGFIGALLLVLWLGTNHDSMDNNLNILAYTPFHLFLPLIVWRVRKSFQNAPRVIVQLHAVLMLIPVVGLILSWLVPQYSWPFFLHAILIQFCIWLRLYRRYQHNDN